MIVNLTIELGQFPLHGLTQSRDTLLQAFVGQAPLTLTFGDHHFDDLTPPCDHIRE